MKYEQFYHFIKSVFKLGKVLDSEFYALFQKSVSNIQDHPDLLYAKFLGVENPEKIPADDVVVSQIKKEIKRLCALRDDYALQDNIYALKSKNHCILLISLLEDLLKE